ncbi:CDP-alcohol phosphatidyltransferase family protein [bacterium]|nr:CDP-alcohol phosphatidyltransferase family protein [bacterium]
MNNLDQKIDFWNRKIQKIRQKYFRPIIKFLANNGLNANQVSSFKIVLAIIYLLIISYNIKIALLFLLLSVIIDIFDGPIARYQQKNSDRGKFIDMFSDHIAYVFFIFGLIIVKIGNPIYLSYNLIIIPIIYLLLILNKNEKEKSDWIIKPVARASFHKVIIEISVLLYVFSLISINNFDNLLFLVNIVGTIHATYHFLKFLKNHQEYLDNRNL